MINKMKECSVVMHKLSDAAVKRGWHDGLNLAQMSPVVHKDELDATQTSGSSLLPGMVAGSLKKEPEYEGEDITVKEEPEYEGEDITVKEEPEYEGEDITVEEEPEYEREDITVKEEPEYEGEYITVKEEPEYEREDITVKEEPEYEGEDITVKEEPEYEGEDKPVEEEACGINEKCVRREQPAPEGAPDDAAGSGGVSAASCSQHRTNRPTSLQRPAPSTAPTGLRVPRLDLLRPKLQPNSSSAVQMSRQPQSHTHARTVHLAAVQSSNCSNTFVQNIRENCQTDALNVNIVVPVNKISNTTFLRSIHL
ncbi:DNA translocase FtsK-like isoform X2 [Hyalella azteca]|uniref:DNA translocase FtsK-like isoform X2 n=1 Tax=Hyalella azteca TaxID=294128 RepID=A0A979FG50_HYAAZ|nr:DNA translocase FtsK-like isoform X2 [Hyalella azteca]